MILCVLKWILHQKIPLNIPLGPDCKQMWKFWPTKMGLKCFFVQCFWTKKMFFAPTKKSAKNWLWGGGGGGVNLCGQPDRKISVFLQLPKEVKGKSTHLSIFWATLRWWYWWGWWQWRWWTWIWWLQKYTHRSIFWVRFGHDDVEVEAILAQLRVRVPRLRALEPLPHRVLDLDKILNNWK